MTSTALPSFVVSEAEQRRIRKTTDTKVRATYLKDNQPIKREVGFQRRNNSYCLASRASGAKV